MTIRREPSQYHPRHNPENEVRTRRKPRLSKRDSDVDTPHFDALTRAMSAAHPRRRLAGALAALLTLGGTTLPDLAIDAEAKDRKRRRKRRHKRRHDRGAGKSGRCKRKSLAAICSGRCGTVTSRKSCGKPVDCGTTCPDTGTVCCEGLCQTQAELNAACPSANTHGFLTFSNGDMRCASQTDPACDCLGGVFRACAPGTACRANGATIICDFPAAV